jgi:hypothetical protein
MGCPKTRQVTWWYPGYGFPVWQLRARRSPPNSRNGVRNKPLPSRGQSTGVDNGMSVFKCGSRCQRKLALQFAPESSESLIAPRQVC